jgi:7-keto-8-aminopelargonate synthetase-like enzyme
MCAHRRASGVPEGVRAAVAGDEALNAFNPDSLTSNPAETPVTTGADLVAKAAAFTEWFDDSVRGGGFAYSKRLTRAPGPDCPLRYADGKVYTGYNFSSQDYLGLATHPEVTQAACRAISRFGVHSAGSTALAGGMDCADELEAALAAHLGMPYVTLFPSGWAAGYGVTRGLVRANDHVIIDLLAHNCLQEGAAAATRNLHFFRHLDVQHARDKLSTIRANHADSGILLVTESLFAVDAGAPDLVALQAMCREFGALLLVDVSHDLGCSGPNGTGQLGLQGLHGGVDLVMGSFAKTFASNGGFVATHRRPVREYFRYHSPTNAFSTALAPAQIAVLLTALRIVRSSEGDRRRSGLLGAVHALRGGLAARQVEVLGQPAAIVPAMIGRDDVARLAAKLAAEAGVLANLFEHPVVARNAARLRLQVMSGHEPADCEAAARCVADAIDRARSQLSARAPAA